MWINAEEYQISLSWSEKDGEFKDRAPAQKELGNEWNYSEEEDESKGQITRIKKEGI